MIPNTCVILSILGDGPAYSTEIMKRFHDRTGRQLKRGSVHCTLDRMRKDGYITRHGVPRQSSSGGGNTCKPYRLTKRGELMLNTIRRSIQE